MKPLGLGEWVRRLRPVLFCIALAGTMVLLALLAMGQGEPAAVEGVKVGLVTDEAGLMDGGFNWFSYQGLLRAEQQLQVEGSVYESNSSSDYLSNLEWCVEEGNLLCLSVGFSTAEAISSTAKWQGDTLFAIVDYAFQSYPENLQGITFASDEAGYLAGTLAGLMTQNDVVGSVAGMQIPSVQAYVEPYRAAAACANPAITTIITYTGSFNDYELGMVVAEEMVDKGADVIFGVGGQTGASAVRWAAELGAWGVGVDTDAYFSLFGGGSHSGSERALSSAMKHLDNAVYETISDVVSGQFVPGMVVYGVAEDGVGLAPFHEADGAVPSTVRGRLERIRQDIIGGSIDVLGDCPAYMSATHTIVLDVGSVTTMTGSLGLATIVLPEGTFTQTTRLDYGPHVPFDPGPGFAGVGLFFDLSAGAETMAQSLQPQRPYTMTVSYSDEEVAAGRIVNENGLGLYWWDGETWVREPSSQVDTGANTVTATPDHFSLWGLLSETRRLFIPTIWRNR